MNKKLFPQEHLLALSIIVCIISCTPTRMVLDVEESIANSAEKIRVSGVKGKRIPGSKHPIVYENLFSGTVKDGWIVESDVYDKTPGGLFSAEATKRNLFLNFGIAINDVTSKRSDKYQFSISDSVNSVFGFCKQYYLGESTNYDIKNRVDFSIANKQSSSFAASFLLSNTSKNTEWLLELRYERETPGGIIAKTFKEGMAAENGFITNRTDTIFINTLFSKAVSRKQPEKSYSMPFPVIGGYEFKMNDVTIGIVDVYNSSIWFFNDSGYKSIVAAASTALLLRNR